MTKDGERIVGWVQRPGAEPYSWSFRCHRHPPPVALGAISWEQATQADCPPGALCEECDGFLGAT